MINPHKRIVNNNHNKNTVYSLLSEDNQQKKNKGNIRKCNYQTKLSIFSKRKKVPLPFLVTEIKSRFLSQVLNKNKICRESTTIMIKSQTILLRQNTLLSNHSRTVWMTHFVTHKPNLIKSHKYYIKGIRIKNHFSRRNK